MADLPAGTVTFVFTDIEGSTTLLKELGDRYGEVLSQHRRIVRETFRNAGGSEIDTQGDAFFYAFPRAREAVSSSVEVQRKHAAAEWPDGALVRVRIGLHTGEPSVAEEGYLGLDVVRAARICTVARGGNVLLSETTRALVGSSLPQGVSVFPIGERHLKDIDEPERVFELDIPGVETTPEPKSERPAPADAPEKLTKPPKRGKERGKDLERRIDTWGDRLAESIQEGVLRMLDRKLAKLPPPGPPLSPRADDAAVDELAERAATFDEKIQARVEELLRRQGIEPR